MRGGLEQAYKALAEWCRARGYAGADPFDALNSRVFQSTPLARSRLARILWTQVFKRSPFNLRRLARVPQGRNPKGEALFALAALSRLRAARRDGDAARAGEAEREVRAHLEELLRSRIASASGAAWGYNFDWQSRNFYAPRGTPTLVPTAFAARAFLEAHGALGDASHLAVARSVCDFILRDLPRSVETADEVCFSYVPRARTRIYNASLLAGETLATVGALTGEENLCEWGVRAARYVARRQRPDGSWPYGAEPHQSWIDNFHTAFVLLSLARTGRACGEGARSELGGALARGYEFWREAFFLADGWPKYYHDNPYPADIHSAAAAVVALVELEGSDARELALRVARWTLSHMRDPRGFFYYQRRRSHTVRTPHMRWGQAWMLYALARILEGMRDEG